MSIVEEYWSGVLRRLQAEVDTFNRLVEHQGEKGRENELSLARVLEGLVPRRYGIGTGLLIDAEGHYSKQMDIIVYDRDDEPSLMAQTNQILFPVENARLCIEVKTTVGKEEVDDAHAKHASIKALASNSTHPLFALVGYKADVEAQTLAKHLRSDVVNAVHMACILQLGLVAGMDPLLPRVSGEPPKLIIGVTPLQDRNGRERRAGSYVKPGDDFEAQILHEGHRYPVVALPNGALVAEPSRALLLFCEALLNGLGGERISSITHYITEAGRDIVPL